MSRFLPLFFLMLVAWGPAVAASDAQAAKKPNILLIVADDLGWGDVGWHDAEHIKTPVMDGLVKTGVELDQHYVMPVCSPTRAALLSGRYPSRFGPHACTATNRRVFPAGTVTLASALQEAGYHTFIAGKWHLGSRPEWGPNHYGFQQSYGTLTGAADPWTRRYQRGRYVDTWHRNGQPATEAEGVNTTELLNDQVIQWIEEKKEPWFIYLANYAVHTPVDTPEKYKEMYRDVKFDQDPVRDDSLRRMAAYVSQLDVGIGRLLEALEKTGQRDNTLIIFTSDNGGKTSARNPYDGNVPDSPANSSNLPLRGEKGGLYEGGIRVCAFANWPGVLKPHTMEAPMHAVDWFPTLAGLIGWTPSDNLRWDGQNMWKAITGEEADPAPRVIYWHPPGPAKKALRSGDWKLVSNGKNKEELFNLKEDPYEKNDLAKSNPEKVAELSKLMDTASKDDIEELPADLEQYPK